MRRSKLRKLNLTRMLKLALPPVPWLVSGLLARGEVTLLYGRPGLGKSLLALCICDGVARGAFAAGYHCEPGRVVYIDGENGEREIHRRVKSLGIHATRV